MAAEEATTNITVELPVKFLARIRKLAEIENRSAGKQIKHLLEYALPLHEKDKPK